MFGLGDMHNDSIERQEKAAEVVSTCAEFGLFRLNSGWSSGPKSF